MEVTATSDVDVTLSWSGDAANATDIDEALPTTVTITAGNSATTLTALDDNLAEPDEDLMATITGVTDNGNTFEAVAVGNTANGYGSDADSAST
ncbi:hypothetical protein ACLUEY_17870, partial [Vreelandella aquamarina]